MRLLSFSMRLTVAALLYLGASLSAQPAEIIHACVHQNKGSLRLVAAPEECKPNAEQPLPWTSAAGLQNQIVCFTHTGSCLYSCVRNSLATSKSLGRVLLPDFPQPWFLVFIFKFGYIFMKGYRGTQPVTKKRNCMENSSTPKKTANWPEIPYLCRLGRDLDHPAFGKKFLTDPI